MIAKLDRNQYFFAKHLLFQDSGAFCLKTKKAEHWTNGLFTKLTRVGSVLFKGLWTYCTQMALWAKQVGFFFVIVGTNWYYGHIKMRALLRLNVIYWGYEMLMLLCTASGYLIVFLFKSAKCSQGIFCSDRTVWMQRAAASPAWIHPTLSNTQHLRLGEFRNYFMFFLDCLWASITELFFKIHVKLFLSISQKFLMEILFHRAALWILFWFTCLYYLLSLNRLKYHVNSEMQSHTDSWSF